MEVLNICTAREQLAVTAAVLLYTGVGEVRASVNPVVGALENDAVIMPGQNLTESALAQISSALNGGLRRRKVAPANLLLSELGIVVWWAPAQRRPIFFQTKTSLDELNAKHVLHPPLLFVGRRRALTVYALPSNERPNDSTQLRRAPYYNLYGHGAMCEGNVPLPDIPLPHTLLQYETAFYDSSFVHSGGGLGNKQISSHPDGHNGLWREMATIEGDLFPFEYLIPLTEGDEALTVEMAINRK